MLYLIRYAEPGREPQPQRSLIERDLVETLRERLPGAQVIGSETGRLFVEVTGDGAPVLRALHGIASFSPCRRCALDDLERTVVETARRRAGAARSFAVRCKRVGAHAAGSIEIAGRLGAAIAAALPGLAVDLGRPDLTVGVEVRSDDCYVYTEVFRGLDHEPPAPGRTRPEPPRFLADQMLGTLATWLRMLGYDTVYVKERADSFLLRQANAERRTLLTRDRPLAEHGAADVLFLESRALDGQVREVLARLGLRVRRERLFTRCSRCNAALDPVAPEQVRGRVPARVAAMYDEFTRCAPCDKVYWRGGHYRRMLAAIEGFTDESAPSEAGPSGAVESRSSGG